MPQTLGMFLRDQLALRQITADTFAKENGLNGSGLYQLIRGEKTNPTLDTMRRIASGLGMTLTELAAAIEGKTPDGQTVEPDLAHVIALWRHLEPGRRDAIKTLTSGAGPPHFVRDNARWQRLNRSRVAA